MTELECIVESDIIPITEETPYTNELTPAIEETAAEPMEFKEIAPGGMDGLEHQVYGTVQSFFNGFKGVNYFFSLGNVHNKSVWAEDPKYRKNSAYSICQTLCPHGGYQTASVIGVTTGIIVDAGIEIGKFALACYSATYIGKAAILIYLGASIGVRYSMMKVTESSCHTSLFEEQPMLETKPKLIEA